MLETKFDGNKLRLLVDGFELLSTPFISAIKHEKTYTSRRGTVKESMWYNTPTGYVRVIK